MNNDEKFTEWLAKLNQLQQKGTLDDETEKFISEILTEFSAVKAQNERLRKKILQQTTGDSRMSTKLRDALYE